MSSKNKKAYICCDRDVSMSVISTVFKLLESNGLKPSRHHIDAADYVIFIFKDLEISKELCNLETDMRSAYSFAATNNIPMFIVCRTVDEQPYIFELEKRIGRSDAFLAGKFGTRNSIFQLESTTAQFDWRFKTEEEFKEEFGAEWRTRAGFNLSGEMDYLCGQVVQKDTQETRELQNIKHPNRTWIINSRMLTNKPLIKESSSLKKNKTDENQDTKNGKTYNIIGNEVQGQDQTVVTRSGRAGIAISGGGQQRSIVRRLERNFKSIN
jgi:hypothetical protein